MRVAIPVEVKIRDLRGAVWLGLNFLEQGHEVVIGETGALRRGIDLIEPDMFFRGGISNNSEVVEVCRDIQDAGGSVAVLDTEGGIAQSDARFKNLNTSQEMLEYTDVYFSWGQRQADIIMDTLDFSSENILLTGHPRFDLLHEELREVYRTELSELTQDITDYILVCTNFAGVNHATKETSEFDKQRVQFESELLNEYTTLVKRLATEFNDYEIVIRPHPAENLTTYHNRFLELKNVSVRREESVRPWILGASAMIHYSSTTGIESALIGTPHLSYQPIEDNTVETLPVTVSNVLTNYSDVQTTIRDYTRSKDKYDINPQQRERLKNRLYNTDGPLAAKRIVNWATENVISKDIDLSDRNVKLKHRGKRIGNKYLGAKITETVGSLFLGSDFSNTRRQVPGISRSKLSSEINLFSNNLIDIPSYCIQPISELPNTFIIEKC